MVKKGVIIKQSYHIKGERIMRKNLMLIVAILLTLISVIFLLIGIWRNNNTTKIVGFILIAITGFVNILRGLDRWDKGK